MIRFRFCRLRRCRLLNGASMKSIQLILCFMPGIEGILKTLGIEPSVLVDDVRVIGYTYLIK